MQNILDKQKSQFLTKKRKEK